MATAAKANVKPIKPSASKAAAPAPAVAAPAEAAPAKKRKKSKLLLPLLGLLLLSSALAVTWFTNLRHTLVFGESAAQPGATAHSAEKKATAFVSLETFTVNLLDNDRDRYLQLGIVLEINDAMTVDSVKQKMPVIRSQILLLLSSKRSAELLGPQAKDTLARDILERARRPIDSTLPDKGIEHVHFSAFMIQ
jgi:flagellar FliL protein